MTNSHRGSLNPVLFGIVVALASVLVVTAWSQSNMALSYDTGSGHSGGGGGSGGLLVCPPTCPDADLDLEEAVEAENETMAGATNQTTTNGNTTDVQFLSIQNAKSGSLSEINATAYTPDLRDVVQYFVLNYI